MTINDMIDAGITIEGEIEIRKWTDYNSYDPCVLFKGYELDGDEWYMDANVAYMFAYDDGDKTILCFELEN